MTVTAITATTATITATTTATTTAIIRLSDLVVLVVVLYLSCLCYKTVRWQICVWKNVNLPYEATKN